MPSAETRSPMISVNGPLTALETDLLVIPWFEEDPPGAVPDLDAATGGEVSRALTTREFTGKRFDVFFAPVGDRKWRSTRIALTDCGKAAECDADVLRKVAAASGIVARQRRIERVGFLLRWRGDLAVLAQAAAEGLTLSEYDVGAYKTSEPAPAALPAWTIATTDEAADAASRTSAAVDRDRLLGECSNLARGLANEPGNTLTPREFARRAAAIAAEGGIQVEVLDEHAIADLGMGMLLGVARG